MRPTGKRRGPTEEVRQSLRLWPFKWFERAFAIQVERAFALFATSTSQLLHLCSGHAKLKAQAFVGCAAAFAAALHSRAIISVVALRLERALPTVKVLVTTSTQAAFSPSAPPPPPLLVLSGPRRALAGAHSDSRLSVRQSAVPP
jgi:hypothetical protein